ncbi:MAG: hypothetical protein ABJG47_09435 [Ekhidna sp.]
MKKLTLIIGLFVAGHILFAQDTKDAIREKSKAKIEAYKERLKLSESQISDLKKMRESLKPEIEAIHNDDASSRSEIMMAKAEIMKRREECVSEILNTKQRAELKKIHREIRENVRQRRQRKRERRKR